MFKRRMTSRLTEAIEAGAIVTPEVVRVPLTAFMKPGAFAAIRRLFMDFGCPKCGSKSFVRFGTRPHGSGRIQQFECTRNCKENGQRTHFTEYTGTPLDGSTVSAHDWLAIWYWRHTRPQHFRTYKAIGRDLGLPLTTVEEVAIKRQGSFIHHRKFGRRKHRIAELASRPDLIQEYESYIKATHKRIKRNLRNKLTISPTWENTWFLLLNPPAYLFTNHRYPIPVFIELVPGDPVGLGPTAPLWAEIRLKGTGWGKYGKWDISQLSTESTPQESTSCGGDSDSFMSQEAVRTTRLWLNLQHFRPA